jgi:phosphoadenosine phosphosulfate reductase
MNYDEQCELPIIGMTLKQKVDKAVALLEMYEDDAGCYELGFSGGKDSVVIEHLAYLAGVNYKAVYNQTTIDPPELVQFIKKHYPKVIWRKPDKPFFKELEKQGLPSRLARWCCRMYKELDSDATFFIFGLRKQEGRSRSERVKLFQPWRKQGTYALNPIAYWSDADVWNFINEYDVPYCSLYDEGFHRLGCIGCPMGRKQRITQFKRWPGFERAWRRHSAIYWATHDNKTTNKFKTAEDFFAWWLSDGAQDKDEGCQMGLF